MNPDDLIKAVPALAKGAEALAVSIPFTGVVKRMLGPAADELAEMLRDKVRLYRYERQIKCLDKAEKMAQEAGFTPQPVAPKILFPLLEGASFEENEDLHTMWAGLLANAASSKPETVRPGFIAVLKQMAPDEAKLLNWFYDTMTTSPFKQIDDFDIAEVRAAFGWVSQAEAGNKRISACLDGLEAAQLIRRTYLISPERASRIRGGDTNEIDYTLTLTERGLDFVQACRPPKASE